MASEEELFASVDALLNEEPHLPPPAERARLREAAGITQARLATALKTTTQSVKNWENGRSEPKSPRLDAYQRLLNGWAAKYPSPGAAPAVSVAATAPAAAASSAPAASEAETADAPQTPNRSSRRTGTSRHPAGRGIAPSDREESSSACSRSAFPARPARRAGR
ncbi:DNA-binding transcriptional regulator YiaG [Streptomyces canus]|uniref:DNA-binding transcriptional regulator YiaG n=1 Tax=Streptomyces canus TaxID=58343 RepID=A0AAW8F4K2_9ACTN|nr:DNA-binding transcriptional regulator YiaG [Streptomyces canus]